MYSLKQAEEHYSSENATARGRMYFDPAYVQGLELTRERLTGAALDIVANRRKLWSAIESGDTIAIMDTAGVYNWSKDDFYTAAMESGEPLMASAVLCRMVSPEVYFEVFDSERLPLVLDVDNPEKMQAVADYVIFHPSCPVYDMSAGDFMEVMYWIARTGKIGEADFVEAMRIFHRETSAPGGVFLSEDADQEYPDETEDTDRMEVAADPELDAMAEELFPIDYDSIAEEEETA